MLVDLCSMHLKRATLISVTDAVIGMEGNGPSNGKPRKFGFLASSLNPFNLDEICSRIIGLGSSVGYIEHAKMQGYCLQHDNIHTIGGSISDYKINVK